MHYSKESTKTGPYGWQIYNWQLRTYRGPLKETVPTNTMIPSSDIVTKEQTWYGEYSIPASTYVVAKKDDEIVGFAGVWDDTYNMLGKYEYQKYSKKYLLIVSRRV